jgi:hypothetical protein
MRGLGHHVEESSPGIDQAALGNAIWVIITAQTRAQLAFAEKVLGRPATARLSKRLPGRIAKMPANFLRATKPRRST